MVAAENGEEDVCDMPYKINSRAMVKQGKNGEEKKRGEIIAVLRQAMLLSPRRGGLPRDAVVYSVLLVFMFG